MKKRVTIKKEDYVKHRGLGIEGMYHILLTRKLVRKPQNQRMRITLTVQTLSESSHKLEKRFSLPFSGANIIKLPVLKTTFGYPVASIPYGYFF